MWNRLSLSDSPRLRTIRLPAVMGASEAFKGNVFKGSKMLTDPYPCSNWKDRGHWPDGIFYSQRECWGSSSRGPVEDKHPPNWEDGDIREVFGMSQSAARYSESRIRGMEIIELSISDGVHPFSEDVTDADLSLALVRANVRNVHRQSSHVSNMSIHTFTDWFGAAD